MKKEIFLKSNTNLCDICVQIWEPEKEPKAILQISHGMAEYVERYEDFANYLNSLDILVIGNDHCGHGKSVPKDGIYGYFGENNGWENLTKDLKMVHDYIQKQYPTLPYILFGHSMGSFLARTYAAKYGENIDAFIFCGTAGKNPILGIAKMIAKSQIKSKGSKTPSPFIDNLAFGTFNKAFSPNRTASDWLTRVDEEVDRYIAHPWCGFIFTTSAFAAMFDGLSFVQSKEWSSRIWLFGGTS